jgi:ATP-dependent DNA helicase RecQ
MEFYEHPYPLPLVEDRTFSAGTDDDEDEDTVAAAAAMRGSDAAGDPALLSMLKDLRKEMSRKLGLQPWIIFGDPALNDMSILYPCSLEELRGCQGVGEGKARKFGQAFVDLIRKYVEENEIIRPDDFVIKSAPNKSANKVYIIQSIDRRLNLEDIAQARGMDMEDLMSEIEGIVATGTKLNLDYYIEQNIDEDVVEDIYAYFREDAESDSVEEAMNELGADYEEMEIRLVRIKFLCEIAS